MVLRNECRKVAVVDGIVVWLSLVVSLSKSLSQNPFPWSSHRQQSQWTKMMSRLRTMYVRYIPITKVYGGKHHHCSTEHSVWIFT